MPSTYCLKSQPSTDPRRSLAIRQIVRCSSTRSFADIDAALCWATLTVELVFAAPPPDNFSVSEGASFICSVISGRVLFLFVCEKFYVWLRIYIVFPTPTLQVYGRLLRKSSLIVVLKILGSVADTFTPATLPKLSQDYCPFLHRQQHLGCGTLIHCLIALGSFVDGQY